MKKEKTKSELRLDAIKSFGSEGLPDDIREGWEYLDAQNNSAKGGVFLLGREAMLAESLSELHNMLATVLNLDVGCVSINMERDEEGNACPVADFNPPEDWEIPVPQEVIDSIGDSDDESRGKIISGYLDNVVSFLGERFKDDLKRKLQACDVRRTF